MKGTRLRGTIKIRLPKSSYEERCQKYYGYESTEDFKMRLRKMLPHNRGASILGAPKPHRCLVRKSSLPEREPLNKILKTGENPDSPLNDHGIPLLVASPASEAGCGQRSGKNLFQQSRRKVGACLKGMLTTAKAESNKQPGPSCSGPGALFFFLNSNNQQQQQPTRKTTRNANQGSQTD
jgi:hypothetical protein